jgi:hypothetical protein
MILMIMTTITVSCIEFSFQLQASFFLLRFADIVFFFFYKLNVCGNTASSKYIGAISPITYPRFASLVSHFGNFAIFQQPSTSRQDPPSAKTLRLAESLDDG